MIYDISRAVSSDLSPWPGDTAYAFNQVARMKDGSSCNVGAFTMSCHFGTHMDSPFHYIDDDITVEQLSVDIFIGKAAIVEAKYVDVITPDYFDNVDFSLTSRVLIRTGAWPENSQFPTKLPLLAPDVPDFLGRNGVKLIGLDVPSVDQLDSKDLPIHRALGRNKIIIVESLDLSEVPPGTYELIALPLRLVGADGCPVRAVLRDLSVSIPEGNRRLGQ